METKEIPITEVPTTKETSIMDYTNISLLELEREVKNLFPKNEYAMQEMHSHLFDALIFRFVSYGYTKKELIEILTEEVKYSITLRKEMDDEEKNGNGE